MVRPLALIIEDDPILGALFEQSLDRAGFDTFLDIGGTQYVSALITRHPALVALDLNLPEALGEQILADLRDLYPEWALPVILVTADSFQAWDLRAQGETVLIKPIIQSQLQEIVLRVKDTLTGDLQ